LEYYKCGLLLNAVDSSGLLEYSSQLYEFQKPRFLVGYSLTARYSTAGPPVIQKNMDFAFGRLTIDQPREAPFELQTNTITTNAAIFQNINSVNGNQATFFSGQFQIAPLEIRKFSIFLSTSDSLANALKIEMDLNMWFMTKEEHEQLYLN